MEQEAVESNVLNLRNLHLVMVEDKCYKQLKSSWLTLTPTACRSVSSFISLNRTDLLMYKVIPPVALSPGELFVIPEKPVKLVILSFRSWHSCTATIWGLH